MSWELEIAGLAHSFGATKAVDGIDMGVGAGEIVGLVGRNGAGKTTTLRAVMGILEPRAGEIRWQGHAVRTRDRLRFGYMPEERGLYPQMGVLEQVAYFGRLHGLNRRAARRNARAVLDRLGLGSNAEDKLVALSHGNQQRAQLAGALVHEPDLLVLDEAFAGLDPSAVMVLGEVLRDEARRHAAVVFSSHQLDVVERLCDRIAVVDAGRLLATGTLEELQRGLPRRLRVRMGDGASWQPSTVDARRVEEDGRGAVFVLEAEADLPGLLRSAMAAGPVEHFAFERGGLMDVYRELVAAWACCAR